MNKNKNTPDVKINQYLIEECSKIDRFCIESIIEIINTIDKKKLNLLSAKEVSEFLKMNSIAHILISAICISNNAWLNNINIKLLEKYGAIDTIKSYLFKKVPSCITNYEDHSNINYTHLVNSFVLNLIPCLLALDNALNVIASFDIEHLHLLEQICFYNIINTKNEKIYNTVRNITCSVLLKLYRFNYEYPYKKLISEYCKKEVETICEGLNFRIVTLMRCIEMPKETISELYKYAIENIWRMNSNISIIASIDHMIYAITNTCGEVIENIDPYLIGLLIYISSHRNVDFNALGSNILQIYYSYFSEIIYAMGLSIADNNIAMYTYPIASIVRHLKILFDNAQFDSCFVCRNKTDKRCSQCKFAKYCSHACQKRDRDIHSFFCHWKEIIHTPGHTIMLQLLAKRASSEYKLKININFD